MGEGLPQPGLSALGSPEASNITGGKLDILLCMCVSLN